MKCPKCEKERVDNEITFVFAERNPEDYCWGDCEHWTEKEPDKSKIDRALKWAKENKPESTDLDELLKKI